MRKNSVADLIHAIDQCPAKEGDRFRDLVAEVCALALDGIVDVPLIRKEVAVCGGRADIELPLRSENLNSFRQLTTWHAKYDIRMILVETKNLAEAAKHEDVSQLQSYSGRFGVIVSRNGFTTAAWKTLHETAKKGEYLILPLDGADLTHLLKARKKGVPTLETILRRKETHLLQYDHHANR
jgi:hypothetical protein